MPNSLTIAGMLEAGDGDGLAIADVHGHGLNYNDLRSQVRDTRDFLAQCGLTCRDSVAYSLRNGPETAALFLALSSYCRVAPLNPNYTAREAAFSLADLHVRMVITAPGAVEAAEAAREVGVSHVLLESDAHEKPGAYHLRGETASYDKPRNNAPVSDDIALLLHTSGTTARPKLVPLTHRNLCLSSSAVRETLRLTAGDRCLSFMPLFHIHGLVAGLLASISAGAAICCARGFQATSFFSWIESSQ